MFAAAGADGATGRVRGGRRAGSDGDSGCLGAELEFTSGEFIQVERVRLGLLHKAKFMRTDNKTVS